MALQGEEKLTQALEMVTADPDRYIQEILYLTSPVHEEKAAQAAGLVVQFRQERHDHIQDIFCSYLQPTIAKEIDTYTIINTLAMHFDISMEEKILLHNECEPNYTPDAVNVQLGSRKVVSIIDFKGQKNVQRARQETKEKYNRGIAKPIQSLGLFEVEVLIAGVNPVTGEPYMDASKVERINERFEEMKKEEDFHKFCQAVVETTRFFDRFAGRYEHMEVFQKNLRARGTIQVTTRGYFTDEIPKIMDKLFGKENSTNYTIDDMFRLSPYDVNFIRLYGLLVEYYDLPIEDDNILRELKSIILWLLDDRNSKGKNIKIYFNRLLDTDRDFYDYCKTIVQIDKFKDVRDAYDILNRCRQKIRTNLSKMYESKIRREARIIYDTPIKDLNDFQPDEPKEEDLNDGLNMCMEEIENKKSKVFIHTGKSQQPFNFFLPTDSGAEEVLTMHKQTGVKLNECKLQYITKDFLVGQQYNNCEVIELTDHWQKSPIDLLNKVMLKNGAYAFSRMREQDDTLRTRESYRSFKIMMKQCLNPKFTCHDWQRIKELGNMSHKERVSLEESINNDTIGEKSLKGFKTIKDNETLFLYKGMITDGDNIYIGKKRAKFLKITGQYDDCRGVYPYMRRAGVTLKQSKVDRERGSNVLTINDLKSIEDDSTLLDDIDGDDIVIKDTRPRVIDYRCQECENCADVWCDLLHKYSTPIKQKPISTKLTKTINDIIKSKAHDDLEGVSENVRRRIDTIYKSPMMYSIESISQLYEGLLIKSTFNKMDTISCSHGTTTDTILIKLPGEKLFNTRKNVPFIFLKKVLIRDLDREDILQAVLLDLQITDFFIKSDECIYLVSRPQRLDLNRVNTLSKSEMRVLLALSVFLDTVTNEGNQNLSEVDPAILIGNSTRLALTTSISQMSLRDPLKYLFTLAIADASDIKGFLKDKFKYHIKSVSDLKLFNDIIGLIKQLISKREQIKRENQLTHQLNITENEFVEGGWHNFDIKSPFTGSKYKDVKQLVNEVLVNVYFVQKELHNPVTNLEKLVEVPCEFEVELKRFLSDDLSKDDISIAHMKRHGCKSDCRDLLKLNLDRFLFNKKTFSGSGQFSYDPSLTMLASRKRMMQESHKAELIRPKIESIEKVINPIVMIDTLTSSKSSTKVKEANLEKDYAWEGDFDPNKNLSNQKKPQIRQTKRLNTLLRRARIEKDNIKSITDLSLIKARVNLWNAIKSQLELKIQRKRDDMDLQQFEKTNSIINSISEMLKLFKDRYREVKKERDTTYVFNEGKFKGKTLILGRDGFMREEVKTQDYNLFCKNTMENYVISETTPVKEAMYDFLNNCKDLCKELDIDQDKMSVVDVCKMALHISDREDTGCEKWCPIIRMFPKGQRTFTDREIYIMDLASKIKLYYIEHSYKHIDKINDYEAISLPGEAKSFFISKQEIEFLIGNSGMTIDKTYDNEIKVMNHLNADESKWSARDVSMKFIDVHFFSICAKPSERLMMMLIQLEYMSKIINIPESVMQRKTIQLAKRALPVDEDDPMYLCTNGYKRNYMKVSYNWLQGNFNYLSSFVHTSVMEALKDVHKEIIDLYNLEAYNRTFENSTNFASMVHSDDGAISTSVVFLEKAYKSFLYKWRSYPRFIFYVTKVLKRKFSIMLNSLKTFCSESIKDFISEFLVNGEFIGNYSRYIINCCGDSSFKSFKEDLSMLMSAPQSMAKRGSTLETLLISVAIVNYHVYHTYSMASGEVNDPMVAFKALNYIQDIFKLDKKSNKASKLIQSKTMLDIFKRASDKGIFRLTDAPMDRNDLVQTLGGYCNPPLHLLALLGAKAHDAFILMTSFRKLLKSDFFQETINNPDKITKTSIKFVIEGLKKSPALYPNLQVLVGAYLLRQELGYVNARYSKFDLQRVNHINIFAFPPSKQEELYPVKYSSYVDFLELINKREELTFLLESLLTESYNITGFCRNTSQFQTRMRLDYQLTKKIDVFQTSSTAVQRLNRLATTNHRLFLPINLLDGLDKIKLSESFKNYDEDKLGLIDSKISMCKGELLANESHFKRFNKMEHDEILDYHYEYARIGRLRKRLAELEQERERLRKEHDKELSKIRTEVNDVLLIISELSTNRNLIEDIEKNHERFHYNMNHNEEHFRTIKSMKGFEELYEHDIILYQEREAFEFSPLRVKMRLNEAIFFMVMIGCYQDMDRLIESYIYTMLATVFNDKVMNFFMKLDIATKRVNVEGKGTATLQMVVYPYQIKQLTYRAEDIIKCTLMSEVEMLDYKRDLHIDELTFENDMDAIRRIIVDLELEDIILDLKVSFNRMRIKENKDENDMYEMLTLIRRYNILYNILLKTLSIYNVKQAYTLSRSKIVDVAHLYFEGFKGNFIKSEIYVGMKINPDILDKYKLDILTEHDESIRSIRRVLDAVTSLIERLQRLFTTEFGPIDVIELLRLSECGKKNMWAYLMEMTKKIQTNLYEFRGYMPILYHLGIIGEMEVMERIDDIEVTAIWHQAHPVRRVLQGPFNVEYRYNRMIVMLNGRSNIIHNMKIIKDHRYNDTQYSGYNFYVSLSKIMDKVKEDLNLSFSSLPDARRPGMITCRTRRGGDNIYDIITESDIRKNWLPHETSNRKFVAMIMNGVTIITDTVESRSVSLVDYYFMSDRIKSMLTLCTWKLDRKSGWKRSEIWSDPKTVKSVLLESDVNYSFSVSHNLNYYVPSDFQDPDVMIEQVIIAKNRRAKAERFAEVEFLIKKPIQVNGMDLKTMVDIMVDIEDSKWNYSQMTMEKLRLLVPIMEPIEEIIMSLVTEDSEAGPETQQAFIEFLKEKIDGTFSLGTKSMIIDYDNLSQEITRDIYRAKVTSTDYQSLSVNILERFPKSTVSMSSLLTSITVLISKMKGISKIINAGSEFAANKSSLEGSDISLEDAMANILSEIMHINNLILLGERWNSNRVKQAKVMAAKRLNDVLMALLSVSYILTIKRYIDQVDKGKSVIPRSDIMGINDLFKVKLYRIVTKAVDLYKLGLPQDIIVTGGGVWAQEERISYNLLTKENILEIQLKDGMKYLSYIKMKLIALKQRYSGFLLTEDDQRYIDTLVNMIRIE